MPLHVSEKIFFGTRSDLKSNYEDFSEESWLGKSLQEFKSHFDYDLRDREFCWKTFFSFWKKFDSDPKFIGQKW